MQVVLTSEARDDLERIGDYIAQDNPMRARSFVNELIEKARSIGDMPRAFPLVPRYAHLGVRRRVHGNYLIFYCIKENNITIIHILQGARDTEALLFPEE